MFIMQHMWLHDIERHSLFAPNLNMYTHTQRDTIWSQCMCVCCGGYEGGNSFLPRHQSSCMECTIRKWGFPHAV